MKGAKYMLLLFTFCPNQVAAVITTTFSLDLVILVIVGLIMVLGLSFVLFFTKRKKKNKREVIPPFTKIIGDEPERVAELNEELKTFGFAYEPNQDLFYSILNPWQREFGYCRLYDEASAAFSMIIDCEPITFEYDGRKWLIELWKGQYGMNTGGEVGIYYTTGPNLNIPGFFNGTFYHAPKDEECINMSFALRKNGNLLFTRSAYHWWLTGFKLGEFSHPKEITMDITLDLYDRKMANVFAVALRKAGYTEDEFSVQGYRVNIHYDKPHTKQPLTRTAFTDYIMQRNNESLCTSYSQLTSEYTDTLDKLELTRDESPNMYSRIMTIGRPMGAFESYSKLKGHLED